MWRRMPMGKLQHRLVDGANGDLRVGNGDVEMACSRMATNSSAVAEAHGDIAGVLRVNFNAVIYSMVVGEVHSQYELEEGRNKPPLGAKGTSRGGRTKDEAAMVTRQFGERIQCLAEAIVEYFHSARQLLAWLTD